MILLYILILLIILIIIYIYKLRNDGPNKTHDFTRKICKKNVEFFLGKEKWKNLELDNNYFWYVTRTIQRINKIKPVQIKLKPSVLCIQCDNRTDRDYVKNGKKNNEIACKHFGFEYNFTNILQTDNPYINKIVYLKSQMEKDYEYVMWIDSDANICPSFNINLLINNYPNSVLFVSRDPDIWTKPTRLQSAIMSNIATVFCSGIFIIKNNSKGKEIVDFMIEHLTNPKKITMYEKIDPDKAWAGFTYEQGIMNVTIRKYRKHCALLDNYYLNDRPSNLNKNSWIIHAMGPQLTNEERNETCLKIIKLWQDLTLMS